VNVGAVAISTVALCSACRDVTPRLGDRERITLADDDGGAPTAPFAFRHFVLDNHRTYLRATTAGEHAGRPSYQLDLDAPSGRSLVPSLGGTAVLVFQYEGVPFPDQFSFYVRNVRGIDSLNVELKSDDTHVSWFMARGLREGSWRKGILNLAYLTRLSPQSGEADRRQIRELLVHFKGKGTILLDGIGSPQPAVRALLEQLESSRTSSRTREVATVERNRFELSLESAAQGAAPDGGIVSGRG